MTSNIGDIMSTASMRHVLPQFTEKTPTGQTTYDPYSKLFEDRIIFLGSVIDDDAANDIMSQLLVLEAQDSDRDIKIYINSPGGSITAMTAIYDTMRYVSPDIQTVCLGQAASAAAIILAAGTKGKRLVLPNARVLIHQPAMYGQSYAKATDIEIEANEITRMRQWTATTLHELTGRPVDEIDRDIEKDKILTADQALEYGLVDEVVAPRPRK